MGSIAEAHRSILTSGKPRQHTERGISRTFVMVEEDGRIKDLNIRLPILGLACIQSMATSNSSCTSSVMRGNSKIHSLFPTSLKRTMPVGRGGFRLLLVRMRLMPNFASDCRFSVLIHPLERRESIAGAGIAAAACQGAKRNRSVRNRPWPRCPWHRRIIRCLRQNRRPRRTSSSRRRVAACPNPVAAEPKPIAGYFTLNICQLRAEQLPVEVGRRLPREVAGVKLGRLAVATTRQRHPEHVDAYHHLALAYFRDGKARKAAEMWKVGIEFAQKFLPPTFSMKRDRLLWGFIENRPFLHLYHGYGLSLLRSSERARWKRRCRCLRISSL